MPLPVSSFPEIRRSRGGAGTEPERGRRLQLFHPSPSRAMPNNAHLLIVDPEIRAAAREALEPLGLEVVEVASGAALVAGWDPERTQLVLLDGTAPGLDSLALCGELRRFPGGEHAPVLLLVAGDDPDGVSRAFAAGATDFVCCPLEAGVLAHRARNLVHARQMATHLRRSEEKLAKAQRIAQLGWWEWDLEANTLVCSQEFYAILGLERDSFGGTYESLLRCIPRSDREELKGLIDATLRGGDPFSTDHRITRSDGAERIVYQQAEVSRDEAGDVVRLVGTIQDITERKRAEDQIRFLAYFDSLTGLPNRRQFTERLARSLQTAQRHNRLAALLFLDLDRFKRINDTLGHSAGDHLLQEVSSRLLTCLRKTDCVTRPSEIAAESVVARLGGDEFIVLLGEVNRVQDAAKVARRIVEVLSEPFVLQGQEVVVTTSIGITLFPFDGEDADTLLKNADTAMYHAKDQGRNNYQFYNESMNATAFERLVLEANLRRALERQEFVLHYQPQVKLQDGRIFGAEALIRWRHPEMGLVPPGKFIPLAEETGLIVPIGEWALRTACEQMRAWQEEGLPTVRIAVNVSSPQFADPGFAATVDRILRATGLLPEHLDLEMTESILMGDVETSILCLRQLKELGVWLSVDDFGTGYSSLSYLRRFAIDTLKVDRSFLLNVPDDPDHVAITSAIIALAHSLHLGVIAEGVESPEQVRFLRPQGCGDAQGFLFSRPVDAEEFRVLLACGRLDCPAD
ncbi:MAG: EAL domain-containing protein [Deferrisomatales bacterium]|nr:EAL domain-containing protein [Deferrisomatales bacterium]